MLFIGHCADKGELRIGSRSQSISDLVKIIVIATTMYNLQGHFSCKKL